MAEPPTASFFQRVEALFERACDLRAEEREAFLDRECGEDERLRAELENLLEHDELMHESHGATGSSQPAGRKPERIGNYKILRECGRGGMGTVYEAEQETPRRRVAIKLIRADAISESTLGRFKREAEILGRLQHPGIAHILEAGTFDDGFGPQPYFAMEFVDGEPLTQFAENAELSVDERLLLFARVCDAVHHAHLKGVLHRDLKPQNVLVSQRPLDTVNRTVAFRRSSGTTHEDQGLEIGLPKILDFGVARLMDAEATMATLQTVPGQLIGTMQYMSPEQALGDPEGIDERSDIYALGVMLFELLAGRPPYDLSRRSLPDAILAIRVEEPTKLSELDSDIADEVEIIIGKALEKEPHRRYASAADLAADIHRYLRHEPITARPPSTWYQATKFAQRNRALVGGVAATVLALLVGTILATSFALSSKENARIARLQSYRSGLTAAAGMISKSPGVAQEYLLDTPEELRGWEWRHLDSLTHSYSFAHVASAPVSGPVAYSADGSLILGALEGGGLGLWAEGEVNPSREWSLGSEVQSLSVPQGNSPLVAVGLASGEVFLLHLETGEETLLGDGLTAPVSVAWDAQGERLAVGTGADLFVWSEAQGLRPFSETATLKGGLAMHPSGDLLARLTEGNSRIIELFDTRTGSKLHRLWLTENPLSLRFSTDGSKLLAGTVFRMIAELDPATLEFQSWLLGHTKSVVDVECPKAVGLVVSSSDDGSIRYWEDGTCVSVLNVGHRTDVSFHPEGALVAYVSGGEIRLWDLQGASERVINDHTSYVYYVDFSPDGSLLLSGTRYKDEIFIYDTQTGDRIDAIEFGPFAHLGFMGNGDVTAARKHFPLRLEDGKPRFSLPPGEEPGLLNDEDWNRWGFHTPKNSWSPDGSLQTHCLNHENGLDLRDASGELLKDFYPVVGSVIYGADFSPDSKWLAIAPYSGVIEIWSVERLELLTKLTEHEPYGAAYCVAFHPTEPRMASGGNDGMIRLWDTETWEQVFVLRGHDSYVKDLCFSPDGTQ
ncbi:MAG: serine/threonine-protein kinase, partial [Planctomycetota bacterium]